MTSCKNWYRIEAKIKVASADEKQPDIGNKQSLPLLNEFKKLLDKSVDHTCAPAQTAFSGKAIGYKFTSVSDSHLRYNCGIWDKT